MPSMGPNGNRDRRHCTRNRRPSRNRYPGRKTFGGPRGTGPLRRFPGPADTAVSTGSSGAPPPGLASPLNSPARPSGTIASARDLRGRRNRAREEERERDSRPCRGGQSLPRLPLGGQRGHDALPGQPHQLRLVLGVDAHHASELLDLCGRDAPVEATPRGPGWPEEPPRARPPARPPRSLGM